MNYLVYKITNKLNNKIYIGAHCTKDVNDNYMGSGSVLRKDQKEYGIKNFEKEILYNLQTKEEMLFKERQIVDKEFVLRHDTYNIMIGGGPITTFNHTVVKDKEGNTFMVSLDDERFLSGELTSVHKNKIVCIDENGKFISITKEQFLEHSYKHVTAGTVTVYDSNRKFMRVSLDDVRFLSGELTPTWKDKTHSEETKKKMSQSAKLQNRTGLNNGCFGTCWITNSDTNKKIKLEHLEDYLADGWIKGRKIK